MLRAIHRYWGLLVLSLVAALPCLPLDESRAEDAPANTNSPRELLHAAKRVVFLGDSITHAGQYVAGIEAWMLTQKFEHPPLIIGAGLPSETVSGLSEEGHAGGQFPRPDVAERLERILKVTQPDLVFACYGMNCGIYQPLDADRFAKYQAGWKHLKERVEAAGAKLIVITPPYYDERNPQAKFSYNEVLDQYSAWLVAQRAAGWTVIDLHSPMTAHILKERRTNPEFTLQPDGVHPNDAGQWLMAALVIQALGDDSALHAKSAADFLAQHKIPGETWGLIQQRMQIRRDAYVGAAGHKRPGIAKGLPIAEAEAQAIALTEKIDGAVPTQK